MKREKFTPKEDKVYTNHGGGVFRCMSALANGIAVMQNINSGWTFTAEGCGIYEDGTIDWDHSTGGYFTITCYGE